MTSPLGLPMSVIELAEFSPVEDLVLAILRADLPDVPSYSLIPNETPDFFVLTRRVPMLGDWGGDERFVDAGRFIIHAFTSDPDGDEKGAILSEAVRVVMRNAGRERRSIPGKGSITELRLIAEPTRKTDWATSSGPVQFADLPTGYWRYESTYQIAARKPR